MSDTDQTTAPGESRPLSSHDLMQDAIGRYVASTAGDTATRSPSSPEPSATAAAEGQSDYDRLLNTDPATQDAEPAGESQEEEAPQLPDPDTIVFYRDDGTPVTVAEAKKSDLRQAKFTQSQQQVQEQARKNQEAAQQYQQREQLIEQARNFYVQRLGEVEKILAQQVPSEPDPQLRFGTDQQRLDYAIAYQDRQEALVRLATAHEEKNRHLQMQWQDQQRQQDEYQKAQKALTEEKWPAWKDPVISQREAAAIRTYAKLPEYNFGDEEINRVFAGIADHRLVGIFRDAVVGRRVREGGAKGGKLAPSMPQPSRSDARSAGPVSRGDRELRAAHDNLGSDRKLDRMAAAVQIQARNETARLNGSRPRR